MPQKTKFENGFKHSAADTFKKPPLHHKDLSHHLHDSRQTTKTSSEHRPWKERS